MRELQGMGIRPDVIVARVDEPLPEEIREKIAMFCNVGRNCVVENRTLPLLYEAPVMLEKEKLASTVCRILGLADREPDLSDWHRMLGQAASRARSVKIALCGKYVRLHDAYLSVAEALTHAGFENGARVEILWTDTEKLTEENAEKVLREADGILVPGGFGNRGVEGKLVAAKYAREKDIPFLGICLGHADRRHRICEKRRRLGGRRLFGIRKKQFPSRHRSDARPARREDGRYHAFGRISVRGAKRYAPRKSVRRFFDFRTAPPPLRIQQRVPRRIAGKGLCISGVSPDGKLVEAVELPEKRFYVGVQFHPEFKSRPNAPHPLFAGFIRAALEKFVNFSCRARKSV